MIVDCEFCHARFLVADHLIPPEGRTVRCGACSNQWHVMKEQALLPPQEPEAEQPPAAEPAPELPQFTASARPAPTANVPALSRRSLPVGPFRLAFPALAALWLVLAVFTFFPRWMSVPGLSSIYSAMGARTTSGVAFADVKMEREKDEDRTRFVLSGNIVNHAGEKREVPTVKVQLKDKHAKAVWTRSYPVNVKLEPGESYPFRIMNVETSFGDAVSSITLDLGNTLQLMNR